MYNFNEDAIREAAYYIWKNNGCQANTSLSDWDAAISQLSAQASLKLKAPKKASSVKVLMPKKTTVKASSLRTAKSIILKPASAIKATASSSKKTASKAVVVKASCSKASLTKTNNKTNVKSATKKASSKKSK